MVRKFTGGDKAGREIAKKEEKKERFKKSEHFRFEFLIRSL